MRDSIRFMRGGELVEVSDVRPDEMLLDYLRERERSVGTKEACREGDCGACTVVVGKLQDGQVVYEPVNSCIQLLGQVDGKDVVTVEDLSNGADSLHPIQEAFVEHHASQCGFCTPGFVMSLFSLFHTASGAVSRDQINNALAGNLCRCTGYRPIMAAAADALGEPRTDAFTLRSSDTANALSHLDDGEDVFIGDEDSFFAAPASVDTLMGLYGRHPDATIVAGGTDVGLWVTKQMRVLPKVIHVGRTAGFDMIDDDGTEILIGAGATLASLEPVLGSIDLDVGELLRRFASVQIRSSGTIGGNVANGSPIGDLPPILIALDTEVHLRKGGVVRSTPIEHFFVEYGVQDRQPGELVVSLGVPRLRPDQKFRCYKVSKRFDQDISAVMGAFRFTIDEDGTITDARLAYGGMAGTPKRASGAEAELAGANLRDSGRWNRAFAALRSDFTPMDDHRASARYRADTAHALLGKALIELAGTESNRTRIVGARREATYGAV